MKKSKLDMLGRQLTAQKNELYEAYKRAAKHTNDPKGVAFLGIHEKLNMVAEDEEMKSPQIIYEALEDINRLPDGAAEVAGVHTVQVNPVYKLDYLQHQSLLIYINEAMLSHKSEFGNRLNARFDIVDSAYEAYTSDGLTCCEDDIAASDSNTNKFRDYLTVPIVNAKVTDISTHLTNILTPPTHMYGTTASKEKMQHAKAVAGMMNVYASKLAHYTHIKGAISDLIKYNLAAIKVDWHKIYGLTHVTGIDEGQGVSARNVNGGVQFKHDVVFEGGRLEQLDVRNIFWDSSCKNVIDANKYGQYVGHTYMQSLFEINRLISTGVYFGDTLIPSINPIFYSQLNTAGQMYTFAPIMEDVKAGQGWDSHTTNTEHSLLHSIDRSGGYAVNRNGMQEITEIYIRLQPVAWNFPITEGQEPNIYKIYKVIMINSDRILYMDEFKEGNGGFPITISTLDNNAQSNMSEKTIAENLVPFQQHANDLMIKDQKALSKSISGGILLYDDALVELPEQKNAISGTIKVKATADRPIDSAVKQIPSLPYQPQAFQQMQGLQGLLESIAPSNNDRQVADLQRATELQAAATIQAGAKRWLSTAKRLDDCLLAPTRQILYYFMLQNERKGEVLAENGEIVPFALDEIKDSGIEFTINNGLQGLDRLLLGQKYEKFIQTLIQAQMTGEYNMAELINYTLSLAGDQTDFTAFKVRTMLDNLPPEAKQHAAELLQAEMVQLQEAAAGGDKNAEAQLASYTQPNPGNFAA